MVGLIISNISLRLSYALLSYIEKLAEADISEGDISTIALLDIIVVSIV